MNELAKALKEAEEEAVMIGCGLGLDPLAEGISAFVDFSDATSNCKKALEELAPALWKLKELSRKPVSERKVKRLSRKFPK